MEGLNDFSVIFLTGLVIKLMDDYLDQEIDRLNGRKTLVLRLERGILPYVLILMTFSSLIDPYLTVSLFWASYIIGMGMDMDGNKLPTGLKAYQEVIVMLGLGFIALDKEEFIFSLAIMLFIQLLDDYIDYYLEEFINRDNFINYLGKGGTVLLSFLSLVISLGISWERSVIVIFATPIVVWLLHR
ncbi:hypothetical protein [Halonatronum saccharophilum]|uniref:hypothetical protein n=1 Tax=Halonatronum saccharophilum TaxID=150060 RepID=UPI000485E335|nr:hypothetical protein [Halonatronum saccharophilum]